MILPDERIELSYVSVLIFGKCSLSDMFTFASNVQIFICANKFGQTSTSVRSETGTGAHSKVVRVRKNIYCTRFEDLSAVNMEIGVMFWDMAPYSLVYCFHCSLDFHWFAQSSSTILLPNYSFPRSI
jgi:hypothetical protein